MDEIEFRKRVYANPAAPEQELVDAARDNPDYQEILNQTQAMERQVDAVVNAIAVPEGLEAKLLAIPQQATEVTGSVGTVARSAAANSSFFNYYAIAASLLLVIGVTFTLSSNRGPTVTDLAMQDGVFTILYSEPQMLATVPSLNTGPTPVALSMGSVNEVMADAGVQLVSNTTQQDMDIYSATPCVILPAYKSAHLVLQGEEGAVSVFVINNSPVQNEYQIRDSRFQGLVMPASEGNMILIGEQGENLEELKQTVANSMDWTI